MQKLKFPENAAEYVIVKHLERPLGVETLRARLSQCPSYQVSKQKIMQINHRE